VKISSARSPAHQVLKSPAIDFSSTMSRLATQWRIRELEEERRGFFDTCRSVGGAGCMTGGAAGTAGDTAWVILLTIVEKLHPTWVLFYLYVVLCIGINFVVAHCRE
jgi:hypothetical protein